jgi:hypothetical protein
VGLFGFLVALGWGSGFFARFLCLLMVWFGGALFKA